MEARTFSKEQIIQRIKFENPWWETGTIGEYYELMQSRVYLELFAPLVEEKRIKRAVVLMGPRRVGKTVLIYHTIQRLIVGGVSPGKICYLSIETPIYNNIGLEELFHLCRQSIKDESNTGFYIFFDEIQYLKNWEVHLKSLVDSYLNTKFVVSGSAAAALKLKSIESGAGRFTDFLLPPLTFHEYIRLKNLESLVDIKVIPEKYDEGAVVPEHYQYSTKNVSALNRHFIDYINYGGYPEVIFSDTIQKDPGRYIRNDIIDKVLLRDLPSLYGIQDIQELNSLFTFIAYNSGNEISLDMLSQNSGVAKNTIKKYLSYLEAAFLIKIVNRIDFNSRKFKRANFFKIYLTNPSLRSALFSPLNENDEFIGNMVETAIYSQWQHTDNTLFYARWLKGEVDVVMLNTKQKPSWVVEIKWSDRFFEKTDELFNINSFCKKHKIKTALITSETIHSSKEFDEINYVFTPAGLYCYAVGRNLIEWKIRNNKKNYAPPL